MEHESTTRVAVDAERVYRAIADVGSLTRFIPEIKSARPTGDGHVDVAASYDGHEQHGEAWFRSDDSIRRVEWGAEGHPYHGWLQVDPDGDGSKLTLHLTTEHATDLGDHVQRTFDSIRKML